MKKQPEPPKDIPGVELAKQLGCTPLDICNAKYQQKSQLTEGKHWYRAYIPPNKSQTWVMWTPAGQEFMRSHFERKRKWHEKRAAKNQQSVE